MRPCMSLTDLQDSCVHILLKWCNKWGNKWILKCLERRSPCLSNHSLGKNKLSKSSFTKEWLTPPLSPLPSSLSLGSAEYRGTCVFRWKVGIQLFDLALKCWLWRHVERVAVCWNPGCRGHTGASIQSAWPWGVCVWTSTESHSCIMRNHLWQGKSHLRVYVVLAHMLWLCYCPAVKLPQKT